MNHDYRLKISTETDDPAWDKFVAHCPDGHHVQTSLWGQVKATTDWQAIRIIVTKDEQIVSGCQLLIRTIPYVGPVGYITKGPLCDHSDPELAKIILQEVLKVGKDFHLHYMVVQPPNHGAMMNEDLLCCGFRPSWLEVAPTASILIDLSLSNRTLVRDMKRQIRQNIRRSEKRGIRIREGGLADIHTFYLLHLATSERQGFDPYVEEYFVKMWEILAPYGNIKLFLADYLAEPVSALLVAVFKDTAIPKLFGWSGLHGDRRPNEALFWGAIKWAKEAGYRYFDMEGIDPQGARAVADGQPLPESLHNSPTRFKLGFGGEIVFYPQPHDYVFNPVMRWMYRQVSPRIAGWPTVYNKVLDRVRMQ
ncbi:MAG: lipid II:glycine glycyltransferase FemX [Candidatus Promineifilaceae bacterium]|jgi:lipid II:glycine glycyltransferase (peptidoglycan interpeptide bridge formation enzyme)